MNSSNPIQAREIGWINVVFLSLSPLVAAFGLWYWIKTASFNWQTIVLTLIFTTIIQVSITAGYHRLFSHRCYQAAWPVRLFFLIFGAAAFEGSTLGWSLDHRQHHNHIDDEIKDPYAITKGFFWAHMGWLLFKPLDGRRDESKAGDLLEDPLVVWQNKYWLVSGILAGYILPAMIAWSWHDFFGGLFIAGFLRAVINHHSTFLINSLSHCFGKQTYSDKHSARDNLLTAILTFGEGYHNYHHEFSSNYRNGPRFFDWDPTKWIIKSLSFIGLTSHLKTIREEIIVRKRWQMTEKTLRQKLQKRNPAIIDNEWKALDQLKEKIESAFKHLTSLKNQYQDIKKAGQTILAQEVKSLKQEIAKAREQFFDLLKAWHDSQLRVFTLIAA